MKAVLSASQIVAIVAGGGVFLFEYWNKVESDRLARSIDFIKESRSGPLREQRYAIDTLFLESSEGIKNAAESALAAGDLTPYMDFIDSTIEHEDLFVPLYATTEFYNSVALCGTSGLCDSASLCDFMFRRIKAQRSTFCPFYSGWSERWGESMTTTIDQFLEMCIRRFEPSFDRTKDPLTLCDVVPLRSIASGSAE